MAHRFTIGVEEEFQIVDPDDVGAALARVASCSRRARRRSAIRSSARCTSRSSRSARRSAPTSASCATRSCRIRRELCQRRRARRPRGRRRRHASVLALEGPGHLARRALREHRRGAAAAGAVAADLRPARARRACRIARPTIDLMNEARYFLPHLLALSTSSPFWMGRDTGLKSYRTTIFRRFPRTGVPDHFGSWSEYENYVQPARRSALHRRRRRRSGGTSGRIRRSARWSSASATCRRASRTTVALAALAQAIIVKLYRLYSRNLGFRLYRRALIEENKWRAARWGLDGKLIDFGKQQRSADARPRARAARVRRRRGRRAREPRGTSSTCTRSCATAPAPTGSSQVYRETGDLRAVVRHVVQETRPMARAQPVGTARRTGTAP